MITRTSSRVFGAVLVLANFSYFIPLTFKILTTGNDFCNMGVVLLPITILTNLLVIPAILALINKTDNHKGLLMTNSLATIWTMYWLTFFLTS